MATKAQTPVTCELCELDSDVNFYCVTCGVTLCSKCKLIHSRIPRTKNDEVIFLSEARQEKQSKPVVTLCNNHPTEEIFLFCERCDMFICNECLVENHQGHQFTTTKNKIGAQKNELTNLLKKIQNKKEVLKKALNAENTVHSSNIQCYDQIRTDISEHVNKIIEKITSLQDEKFAEVSTFQQKENERHSDTCTNIESLSETLNATIQLVQTAIDSGNPFTMEKAKHAASKLVQNVQVPPERIKDVTKYEHGHISRPAVMPLFGDIVTRRVINVEIKSSVVVKVGVTKQNIGTIVPTARDRAWIIEADKDKQLTMVNRAGCTVEKSVQLCDGGSFIIDAKKYSNDLLVTCYKEHRVIRLSGDGKSITTFSDVQPYCPLGLYVTHEMDVLVCLKSSFSNNDLDAKVVKLNSKGDTIQSIKLDDKGDAIYSWPYSVTSLQSGEIVVCDRDQHMRVSCVNSDGHLMFTWTGEVPERKVDKVQPMCITHDKYNNLFLTDNKHHKVWMLSKDGTEAKCLIDSIQGIKKPHGISVDDHGQLWVACDGGKIHIFEY